MRRSQSSLRLVDGGEEIFEVVTEVGRPEFSHPFEVTLRTIGHHGEFGSDRRQVFPGHPRTLDRPTRPRPGEGRR